MAEKMRAAVVRQCRAPLTIGEIELPTPAAGQILVRFEATGVCHTDLHAANGIVGTRQDLEEALQFAAGGKATPHFAWDSLENINDIFRRMEAGKIDGRIVMRLHSAIHKMRDE